MFIIRKGNASPKYFVVDDTGASTLYRLNELKKENATQFNSKDEAEDALRRSPWKSLSGMVIEEV